MIRILPGNIANLIAAGEVVNRPSSALKELMENSIDAGATAVQVYIEDAGRTLIQVIDNGHGMSEEDAKLCFERHATSKIENAEDLEKIMTYGFRGEALASIGAVAEVTLKTRREEQDTGILMEVSESAIKQVKAVAAPKGTNIAIKNLFFNVPARRKFLKSDAAELRHITQDFQRIAIANPNLAFSLFNNGKPVYQLKKAANEKQRISEICGLSINKELIAISTDTSVVKVHGFIGIPEEAKKTPGNQFLFVNGRFFRSPYLHKAICKSYENLIKEGYTPSYFIFLEIDPTKVDVNIHPSKTEVKFEDESVIFEILHASVRESLGRNSFVPSIDFESGEILDIPVYKPAGSGYVAQPKVNFDPLFNPFEFEGRLQKEPVTRTIDQLSNYGAPALFDDRETLNFKNAQFLRTSGDRYIIVPSDKGLVVINTQRARERVFYNRFFPVIVEQQAITQQTLYPEKIDLDPVEHSRVMECLDNLNRLGFDIRDFGSNSIVVYGLPTGFSSEKNGLKEILDNMLDALADGYIASDNAAKVATGMARSAARNCGKLTDEEALVLIETVLDDTSTVIADSRKCCMIITFDELEKRL